MKLQIMLIILVLSVIISAGVVVSYEQGIPADSAAIRTVDKTYHIQITPTVEERYINYNKRVWFEFGADEHYITFIATTPDTAEYHMTWEDNTIIMDLDETAEFDVDGDGSKDLKIWLKDIFLETTTIDISEADSNNDASNTNTESNTNDETNTNTESNTNDNTNANTESNTADTSNTTNNADVNTTSTDKKGMAWWIWALIGLAIVFSLGLAFRKKK